MVIICALTTLNELTKKALDYLEVLLIQYIFLLKTEIGADLAVSKFFTLIELFIYITILMLENSSSFWCQLDNIH